MYPWFWFWAPQVHWPLSGDVRQRIEPDTNWFFGAIPQAAGHGRIEQKLFETASYGKQLGYLTEALLAVCEDLPVKSAAARKTLAQLQSLAGQLEQVKTQAYASEVEDLFGQLQQLRLMRPDQFAKLARESKLALPGPAPKDLA